MRTPGNGKVSRSERGDAGDAKRGRLLRNPDTGLVEPGDHRITVHSSHCALVEDASVTASRPPPSGYEERYQLVLPYWGLFEYSVGSKAWLVDPNQILFVTPGREFRDAHPVPGVGHAAIIVNPAIALLDELLGGGRVLATAEQGTRPATRESLLLGSRLRAFRGDEDELERDEWTIRALREAVGPRSPRAHPGSKVVRSAKEFVHEHSHERLSLERIAKAARASPVYLSQEFTRTQGMPLYRYLLMLRMNRALLELPHCDDITGLAVNLGFSSHSHFSATFRKFFATTPAEFRACGAVDLLRPRASAH